MSKIKLLTIIISFLALNNVNCMDEDCKQSTDMPYAQSLLSSGKLTLKSHAQVEAFLKQHANKIEIETTIQKNLILLGYFKTIITISVNLAWDACEYIIETQLKDNPKNKEEITQQIKADVETALKFEKKYKDLSLQQKKQLNDFIDNLIEQKIQTILQKK